MTWLKGKHSISFGGSFARIGDAERGTPRRPTATLTFGTASLDTAAYNMLDATSGQLPRRHQHDAGGYARNLYGFLTGRVTNFAGTAYLQPDGTYNYKGERTGGRRRTTSASSCSDSWRAKPNLTMTGGAALPGAAADDDHLPYSRPETWQMVYGMTGAGSGKYGQGNLYKPGTLTGTVPLVVAYENERAGLQHRLEQPRAERRRDVAAEPRGRVPQQDPQHGPGVPRRVLDQLQPAGHSSSTATTAATRAAAARPAARATTGTPILGVGGWPGAAARHGDSCTRRRSRTRRAIPLTPAINETIDIHYPDWPVPQTHQYSFGFQRELGKSMALDIRYVGNTNVGGWTTWNMNSTAQWSMLKGENGFYDEFRLAQANLRANIVAGQGQHVRLHGRARHLAAADLPGVLRGHAARRRARTGTRPTTRSRTSGRRPGTTTS